MNPTSEQALVPPRPNLGPEPWAGEGGLAPLILTTGVVLALAASWLWARRRRRRRPAPPPAPEAADESPEARLLALCERLRATLSARFGFEVHARTTEEIAGDPEIRDVLGAERFERMTGFLLAGDRLKFAGRDAVEGVVDQLGAYESWAPSLEALPKRRPQPVNDSARRSPGDRTGRRSPRTRPRRPGS